VFHHVRVKELQESVDEEGSIALNLSKLVERWMVDRQGGSRLPVCKVEGDEALARRYGVRLGTDPAFDHDIAHPR
jgi:hypothetical protein